MANYQKEYLRKKSLMDNEGVEDLSGPTPGSAYKDMSRNEYEKRIRERNVQESRGTTAEGMYEENTSVGSGITDAGQQMGGQMAQNSAQQGDMLGTAGGAMMMSGNPYLMAAGLGLQVYSSGEQNKRAQEEQQRKEYNDRIARRQQMMQNIANMGIA